MSRGWRASRGRDGSAQLSPSSGPQWDSTSATLRSSQKIATALVEDLNGSCVASTT
jgi:hypothetical protein